MHRLLFLACILILSTPSIAQKYEKLLDQQLTMEDLAYMPTSELQQLKNEIILFKGSDVRASKGATPNLQPLTPNRLLDDRSEKNIALIDQLQVNQAFSPCKKEELFQSLIYAIDGKERIPLYLQWLFFGQVGINTQAVYRIPGTDRPFVGIVLSQVDKQQEKHQIFTFSSAGLLIDELQLSGAYLLENDSLLRLEDRQMVAAIETEGKIRILIE